MGWAAVAALAALVHCGGQALMVFALSRASGAEAGLIMMLQPVAAALLGWLLLGVSLTTLSAAGGLVVLAGLCMAILRPDARLGRHHVLVQVHLKIPDRNGTLSKRSPPNTVAARPCRASSGSNADDTAELFATRYGIM